MNKRKLAFALRGLINAFPFNNKMKGKVAIENKGAILRKCRIVSGGRNNKIVLGANTMLDHCVIRFYGSDNTIVIGDNCLAREVTFYMEDCDNAITVGNGTNLCGKAEFATIEGTKISLGEGCLFSSDIMVVTGDSHSILDASNQRINPSQDIKIGNRVWVGHRVSIRKNASIADDTVIGEGAIVTKAFSEANTVLAGVPAKVIKTGVHWQFERI